MSDSSVKHHIPTDKTGEPLIFTESAALKVKELIDQKGNINLNLRVYITGGGCSGFQYGFSFDETINRDDTLVSPTLNALKYKKVKEKEDEGGSGDLGEVKLVIDPMSLQYLLGAEIDYEKDIQGSQFVIRNPNAKTTCGCGSSFAI